MDKIELTLTEIVQCERSILKQYDITVSLNDKVLNHNLFNSDEVIPGSRFNSIEFDLFTCECGEPACAGYYTKVIQNKTKNTVKWTFPEDESYKVDKLEFEFDLINFEEHFELIRKEMLALEKQNIHIVSSIRDIRDYINDENVAEDHFEVKETLKTTFDFYEGVYEAREILDKALKENLPNYYKKSLVFNNNGKNSEHILSIKYLVCKMLNKFPTKKDDEYIKTVNVACDAIEEMLSKKDSLPFIKIIDDSYSKFTNNKMKGNYQESFWDAFQYSMDDITTKEEFNLDNIILVVNE